MVAFKLLGFLPERLDDEAMQQHCASIRGARLKQTTMSRLLISAAHKSSGKTTITVGLCAALSAQGLTVQPFKKGPGLHRPHVAEPGQRTRACFNLDPYPDDAGADHHLLCDHAARADISIVEGNKGLYDGLALDGSNSNAALAQMLDLPVVLVLDARGMTRGIAPLILGYQAFDRAFALPVSS
jgi:cobyrinic acid a,c-diamide synthase